MSSFTTKLEVTPYDDIQWELIEPFDYCVGDLNDPIEVIKVPVGFLTDFASVPRILWNILPPYESYGKAAVLHDYLYYTNKYPRKVCDDIFLEAMEVLKVPKWKRLVIYYSVRIFGGKYYKETTKKNKLK